MSTHAKAINVLPQTVPICDSLELFCGVHSGTSDQHTDLRATATARDSRDAVTFCNYFTSHPPFAYGGKCCDNLINIATRVVIPKCSNADCAVELGTEAAAHLAGQNRDFKLLNPIFSNILTHSTYIEPFLEPEVGNGR